jgi:hypothetical protein
VRMRVHNETGNANDGEEDEKKSDPLDNPAIRRDLWESQQNDYRRNDYFFFLPFRELRRRCFLTLGLPTSRSSISSPSRLFPHVLADQ